MKKFKPFMEENEAGRFIISPFYLEHLLNLFFQGYIGEVWEEVMDTKINHSALIENWAYGIIGQEFDKKHLDLSNSSPPVGTLPNDNSAKAEGFNKDLTATQQVASPKSASQTSLNPD